jgi:glycerol kinase
MIGDQQSALLGQSCVRVGQIKATYGTGVFALMHTWDVFSSYLSILYSHVECSGSHPVTSKHGLITTLAYQDKHTGPLYALEGSVASAGSVVTWLRDGIGLIDNFAALDGCASQVWKCSTRFPIHFLLLLLLQVADTGGVMFVPCLGGLLAPHWRPDARGVLFGLSQFTHRWLYCSWQWSLLFVIAHYFHFRGHIVRAALQGIALQTTDVLEAICADAAPTKIEAIKGFDESHIDLIHCFHNWYIVFTITNCRTVDGGLSVSKVLLQLQANTSGARVFVHRGNVEATALGAARAAAIAESMFVYEDFSKGVNHESEWVVYEPQLSEQEKVALLTQWRAAVARSLPLEFALSK